MRILHRFALLSLVVLLALVACNGEEEQVSEPVPTATTAPPTDTPEPTAAATEAPPPTAAPPAEQAPAQPPPPPITPPKLGDGQQREDIPLMPDASDITAVGNEVTYKTASPVKDVAEFYKAEMPKNGWTPDDLVAIVTEFAASLVYHKGGDTATIAVAPGGDGGSRVTILVP